MINNDATLLVWLGLIVIVNCIEMHGEAHVIEKNSIQAPQQCLHSMIYKGLRVKRTIVFNL